MGPGGEVVAVAERRKTWRAGVLLAFASVSLIAMFMIFGGGPDPAEAAIQGTIRGSAQTLSGSLTLNNGSGTITIPNPNAVSLPAGGSSSDVIDFTDPGSLTVRITGSASVECNGSSSAPLVIDATCTSTITNFALSFQSITAITIGRIVMKSQTVATGSSVVSASTGTTVENVCVKEGLGLPCKAIPSGGSVSFNFPPMSGTVSLQSETSRQTDGNLTGSGLRVTGVRISLTLIPTQQAPTGGSLSLTVGVADTFIGGLSTPTAPATNTSVASPTPTRTPTPTGPPDARPYKAVLPVLSRDD
jgi:hypothetical protein